MATVVNMVLPPSALAHDAAPRHGRSRGASFRKGKGGRSRGYSMVEDGDTALCKALAFVLKRSLRAHEVDEDDDGADVVVADEAGWAAVKDLLAHSRVSALEPSLDSLTRAVGAKPTRLAMRQSQPDSDAEDAGSWEVRLAAPADLLVRPPSPTDEGRPMTPDMTDLPDFVVYGTSYARYPLMLAAGGIGRVAGTARTPFASAAVVDSDVSIWVHLASAMAAAPGLVWKRTAAGQVFTEADVVPTAVWTRAVARRHDVGVLWEHGRPSKEMPAGLRGRGAKGKNRKGKGSLNLKAQGEEGSGSASDE